MTKVMRRADGERQTTACYISWRSSSRSKNTASYHRTPSQGLWVKRRKLAGAKCHVASAPKSGCSRCVNERYPVVPTQTFSVCVPRVTAKNDRMYLNGT